MSKKSPAEFSELFGQSPAPKSPPQLDQRILQYARRNAPQSTRRRQSLFLTAAATFSVAGIGILIALRSGELTPPLSRPQPTPLVAPATDRQTTQTLSSRAAEHGEELAAISRYATKPETTRGRSANAKQTEALTDKSSAQTIPQSIAHAPADRKHPQAQPLPGTSITARGATAIEKTSRMAAAEGLEQATVQQALDADKKNAKKPAKLSTAKATDEYIRKSLQKIKEHFTAGNKSEAEAAYRILRKRCVQCELPQSLEQALTELSPDTAD